MVFYVYILACFKDDEFSCYYTGQTYNLFQRFGQHFDNIKYKDTFTFTGRFDYVVPIWYECVETREEALELEEEIKCMDPDEKEEYMEENGKITSRGKAFFEDEEYDIF